MKYYIFKLIDYIIGSLKLTFWSETQILYDTFAYACIAYSFYTNMWPFQSLYETLPRPARLHNKRWGQVIYPSCTSPPPPPFITTACPPCSHQCMITISLWYTNFHCHLLLVSVTFFLPWLHCKEKWTARYANITERLSLNLLHSLQRGSFSKLFFFLFLSQNRK